MTPIQQLYLGVGAKKKTYMDDVFSTYLYTGNGGNQTINNGVDNTKGGLVWFKSRSNTANHALVDTVRGAGKKLSANSGYGEATYDESSNALSAFTSTGFSLKDDDASNSFNQSNITYSTWNFRKAPGFFDVVTYSGNGTAGRTISHSLGSVPGMIIVKSRAINNWYVHHRGTNDTSTEDYVLSLDTGDSRIDATLFNDTLPTSTNFTLGSGEQVNGSGIDYVAYVFAGGESTAATARSVKFDGSDDYLSLASSSDFNMGTGNYTIECWFKLNSFGSNGCGLWTLNSYADGQEVFVQTDGKIGLYSGSSYLIQSVADTIRLGQWYHVAVARKDGVVKLFVNGLQIGYSMQTGSVTSGNGAFYIGVENSGSTISSYVNGYISNLRVVKGTGVYLNAFKPPTEPLTNITNTTLLCCDDNSATGATVKPGTITANSLPTGNHPSPFDDPAAFTFGDAGNQGIIKCGSYVGNGSSTGPEINLGWEPQWLMVKRTDSADAWIMVDNIRGISTGGNEAIVRANEDGAEYTNNNRLSLRPNGFQVVDSNGDMNGDGGTYVYVAIRRPDGYVGKPAEAGTDVFAMDTGNSSSTIPVWDSGFPVDYALYRQPATTDHWWTSARLMAGYELRANLNANEGSYNDGTFDSNVGWNKGGLNTNYMSWMWKRHAGFDVVTYDGSSSNRQMPHSLNAVPEMIWVKNRGSSEEWAVYHKGLNGGTNPQNFFIELDNNGTENDNNFAWTDTAPTSTHFSLGVYARVNNNAENYIAMLFASVDGISKVGYYTGTGSDQTISLGFTPRFVFFKCTSSDRDWMVFDTLRGIAGSNGNDSQLRFNHDAAAYTGSNYVEPATNGITVKGDQVSLNENNENYIYYAHA